MNIGKNKKKRVTLPQSVHSSQSSESSISLMGRPLRHPDGTLDVSSEWCQELSDRFSQEFCSQLSVSCVQEPEKIKVGHIETTKANVTRFLLVQNTPRMAMRKFDWLDASDDTSSVSMLQPPKPKKSRKRKCQKLAECEEHKNKRQRTSDQ